MRCARLVLAVVAGVLSAASARTVAGQAAPSGTSSPSLSKLEIYGGYLFLQPFTSDIDNIKYQRISSGGLFSASYFFKPNFGVQVEGAYAPQAYNDHECYITGEAGPVARIRLGRFVPFVHFLGGAARVGGPAQQPCDPVGWGVTGGGGLDYILPAFGNHFAVRPIQADFTYEHIDNGALNPRTEQGGLGEIYSVRLSAGLSFRFGNFGAATPSNGIGLNCSADPIEAAPGAPVTLTAAATNLKDGRDLHYRWTTTGGTIQGDQATETLSTAGLAPGIYNVGVHMVRGARDRIVSTCTTSFSVRRPEPPSITCSANRAAINSGDPVVITSIASSPAHRALSYSYSTTSGQVTGTGPVADLTTAGTTPGAITVTCKVLDDQGQSAQSTAYVVIATPAPPPPQVLAHALCSLSFERDARRPDRVDNEAKGCLDDVALTLNRDTTAKLVLVGSHAAHETDRNAAERALNASDYLTREKGIDPARLDLRISNEPGRQVTTTLVPAGSTYADAQAARFDASKIERTGQAYGMPGQTPPARKIHQRRPALPPTPAVEPQ